MPLNNRIFCGKYKIKRLYFSLYVYILLKRCQPCLKYLTDKNVRKKNSPLLLSENSYIQKNKHNVRLSYIKRIRTPCLNI